MADVIVTGCNITGLGLIRSLGKRGINVIGLYSKEEEIGRFSRYLHKAIKAPSALSEPEKFLDFLIDKKEEWKGNMIIPHGDAHVELLSKNKTKLSKYFIVAVPDWGIISKVLGKDKLMELAEELGIPHPITFSVGSLEQIDKLKEKIVYPCIIKPNKTHLFSEKFKKKVFVVNNYQELCSNIGLCFSGDCGGVTIQEIIPGAENKLYGSRFYVSEKGEILTESGVIKSRQSPPNFGVFRVGKITKINPEIKSYCAKIINHLKYTGHAHFEFKFDERDKQFKLLDFNPRFHLDIHLDISSGLDKPYYLYDELVNHNTPIKQSFQGDEMYWINLVSDLHYFLKCYLLRMDRSEKYSLGEYLTPYTSKKVFAVLSFNDLFPTIAEAYYSLKNLIENTGAKPK